MFQKNIIMKQDHINFLHNTKEDWLVLIERVLCQLMEQILPKTGNTLEINLGSIYFY